MKSDLFDLVERFKNGAVGLLPSDTVYGISCLALNEDAVARVYKLKDRDYVKPLIILLADNDQAGMLGLNTEDLEPARKYWPAPLTVIVPASKVTPRYLHRGTGTLAVRVPDKAELRDFIRRVGPIVSTSANPQGKKPARNPNEAKKYFGEELDFYIDAGVLQAQPSTIVKLKDGKLKPIRKGAFPASLIT